MLALPNDDSQHLPDDSIFDMDVSNECEMFTESTNIQKINTVLETKTASRMSTSKPSIYDRLVGSLGRLCRCIGRKHADTSTDEEEQEGTMLVNERQAAHPLSDGDQRGKIITTVQIPSVTPKHNESHDTTMTDIPTKSIDQGQDEKSSFPSQSMQQQVIVQVNSLAPLAIQSSSSPFAMVPHPLAMMPTTVLLGMLPTQPIGPLLPPQMAHQGDVGRREEAICLVLDLDETLVHSSFSCPTNIIPDLVIPLTLPDKSVHDIYVCKRPGVDVFLERVLRDFEVVIFTASLPSYADPVINFLDAQGRIRHRLYRDACVQLQGLYIKDLSRLGRALDKTLLVDNSPASFLLHPEHAMAIKSWFSDAHDSELCRLGRLLDDLHSKGSISTWRSGGLAMGGHPVY